MPGAPIAEFRRGGERGCQLHRRLCSPATFAKKLLDHNCRVIGQASGWGSRIYAVNDEAQVAGLSKFTWNGGLVGGRKPGHRRSCRGFPSCRSGGGEVTGHASRGKQRVMEGQGGAHGTHGIRGFNPFLMTTEFAFGSYPLNVASVTLTVALITVSW